MSAADAYRAIAYAARAIPGADFGLREHTVSLLLRLTSGNVRDVHAEDEQPITEANNQPPKVRWLNEEELTVGGLPKGTIEVGPITPAFPGGGTDLTSIQGADLRAGDQRYLRIRGPMIGGDEGALYMITKIDASRALRIMLQAKPVEAAPTYT